MAIRTVTRAGVGLVVGIIILGVLVLGGLWLVRERGEQARREEAITIADQQLMEESNQGIALDTNKDADKDTAGEAAKPEESTQNDQPGNTTTNTQSGTATELPQTGPEAVPFVAIGLLSFAVMSFMRSRKHLLNQQ